MPPVVIDLVIAILILGVTYALSSEGVWGAALMFFNVMFSGLIAFNFYEWLAKMLIEQAPGMAGWADLLCLSLLFLILIIVFRVITDSVAPSMVRLPKAVYQLGRLGFGFATAAMLMGIVICIFETAPVHRKMFGQIDYNKRPPFGQGLDHKWLAFVQYTTENSFPSYYSDGDVRMFDPFGQWLIDHQNARPYHPEDSNDVVPPPEADAPPAAGAAVPFGGAGATTTPPAGRGRG